MDARSDIANLRRAMLGLCKSTLELSRVLDEILQDDALSEDTKLRGRKHLGEYYERLAFVLNVLDEAGSHD